MFEAWLALHEIKKSKNNNPEKLERKFLEQMNSLERMEYARLELMKFGWWNCANQTVQHLDIDINYFKITIGFTRNNVLN